MKAINRYINEQQGSRFKEEVRYTTSDWEKWKKNRPDDVYVSYMKDEPGLELVYIPDGKNKTMRHIATYHTTRQVLFCDDITLFGHEVR